MTLDVRVVPEKTHEAWLELEIRDAEESPELGPEWRAAVRFDGCVHLTRRFNRGTERAEAEPSVVYVRRDSEDYLHICSVPDTVAVLEEVRRRAVAHFGRDWA